MVEGTETKSSNDKEDQKRFYDKEYETDCQPLVYKLLNRSRDDYANTLKSLIKGKRVLDYGCGHGISTILIGEVCASVVGIDISDSGIARATEEAARRGAQNVEFHAMDAEQMSFDNDSFDVVCGMGILHHLHLEKSLQELARVLKPNGVGVFVEPMGHNPLARLFRALTPNIRPKDESPIRKKDFALVDRYFQRSDYKFSHFLSLPFTHLQKVPGLGWIYRFFCSLDQGLFRIFPSLRLQALEVIMVFEGPRE